MSRVLVVTNDFPPRRGGIESFVRALCGELPAEDVVVYTASMPGDRELDLTLPFPVYRDPGAMLLPTPAVRRRVVAVLARHGCDRVLFGAAAPLGLLAPHLRRAGARRIVALTHGHEVWWARVPGARQGLRRIGRDADVLTYVSRFCGDRIGGALSSGARARMVRLSPGVDPTVFFPGCGGDRVRHRLGIATSTPVVVCTARLVRRKGHDTLLRAWPRVRRGHPTAVLLLVGDGPSRRRLARLTRRLDVEDSVVFAGSVPWAEVPAYTDAGDVFAMPCRTLLWGLQPEAWGIVAQEAAACGLPVVVGPSGGAPEALVPGAGQVADGVREVTTAIMALLAASRGAARRVPEGMLHWSEVGERVRALLELPARDDRTATAGRRPATPGGPPS